MAQRGHHPKEVDAAIKKEKIQAAGHDGCPAELIKWEATRVPHDHRPVQPGWTSERVPTAWRKGNVTSIFKGGSMDATHATAIAQSQFCQS
jgi:hypothetical protein